MYKILIQLDSVQGANMSRNLLRRAARTNFRCFGSTHELARALKRGEYYPYVVNGHIILSMTICIAKSRTCRRRHRGHHRFWVTSASVKSTHFGEPNRAQMLSVILSIIISSLFEHFVDTLVFQDFLIICVRWAKCRKPAVSRWG